MGWGRVPLSAVPSLQFGKSALGVDRPTHLDEPRVSEAFDQEVDGRDLVRVLHEIQYTTVRNTRQVPMHTFFDP